MLLRTLTPLGVGEHRGRYKTADYRQQTTLHYQGTGFISWGHRMVLAEPDMGRTPTICTGRAKNVHRQGGHRGLYRKAQDTPSGVTTQGGTVPNKQPLERALVSWHTFIITLRATP